MIFNATHTVSQAGHMYMYISLTNTMHEATKVYASIGLESQVHPTCGGWVLPIIYRLNLQLQLPLSYEAQ